MRSWVEVESEREQILLLMSKEELRLLANSLNEAINGIQDWEFSTRLGVEKDTARATRDDVRRILRALSE